MHADRKPSPVAKGKPVWLWCGCALLVLGSGFLTARAARAAQRQKDPITEAQADQVRELADRPNEKIKLFLKYVEDRASAIRQLSLDSHENNRPSELRAKYEEFTRLTDELADNADTYASAHADIRKSLKAIIEASGKWPDALNKPASDPYYDFARKTALDAAESSHDDAVKLLDEQEKYFAAHKDEAGKNGKAPTPPINP